MRRLAWLVVLSGCCLASSQVWACPDREQSDPYQPRYEQEYRPASPPALYPSLAAVARQAGRWWPVSSGIALGSVGLVGIGFFTAQRRTK
ncbi:MAG: hypothetical protein AB7O62_25900 [Pirellulales bacterium]